MSQGKNRYQHVYVKPKKRKTSIGAPIEAVKRQSLVLKSLMRRDDSTLTDRPLSCLIVPVLVQKAYGP